MVLLYLDYAAVECPLCSFTFLFTPFLSFLPFAKAYCFHYNIAYGRRGPPNLTPEAGKRVQRGAERGCAPATLGWNRLEGTLGNSSMAVKQNQL